jgi:hypothetical protein
MEEGPTWIVHIEDNCGDISNVQQYDGQTKQHISSPEHYLVKDARPKGARAMRQATKGHRFWQRFRT